MSEEEAICPAVWRGAACGSSKCELPDNLEAHQGPVKPSWASVPGHREGQSFWGVTAADRARWAAIKAAGA